MRTVSSFLRYGAFLSLPHSFGIHHYFIRYAAVCCGCLSWLHQWRIPHRTCRFYWLLAGADKETAFCLGCLYCFLQYRIPHRICRFYLLLAGAHKEATLFLGFYSGFTSGEYHVIRVDFIVALRRTKGRRRWTLRSPSPPWNHACVVHWTPPPHPGESAAAGHICCRGGQGYRIPVSGADCLSPLRRGVWGNCVRAWTVRVSVDFVGLVSFVFHWWWDGLFVPAATWCFAIDIRCITADRAIAPILMDASPFHQRIFPLNCAGCKNIEKMRSCS